ncbi:kinesin-like protein KIN-12D isoform X2 [Aristolochia californica]|uniref:kinesin-like protein KIN-12D isoform X2 n=1 Tax=Aristolochia californica TaxID=171875 RepID=UPI0035D7ED99
MLRDLKLLRHNSGKNPPEGNENLPSSQRDSSLVPIVLDPARTPLNAILESSQIPKSEAEHEPGLRSKADRTPARNKRMISDPRAPFRTPDKPGVSSHASMPVKSRFGWGQKNETSSSGDEIRDEVAHGTSHFPLSGRGAATGNWSFKGTPRVVRTPGKASSVYSESSSTQSTPTKSVTKPQSAAFGQSNGSRPPVNGGNRAGNFALMSRGISGPCVSSTAVNTVEVPHFELREDPSFWMDNNVQVLIRVRPLNSTEQSSHGYSRCMKQDSAQTVTWIGQPETRFRFDHVACETINQETLFRVAGLPMVENCLSGYNSCMFAYGQTGSGKTYTMLGEIEELEVRQNPDRGMTPRIFEFLFARIKAEEESRRDERLKYSCKCSFLEIYNEQITDLLEPLSTNLLLREDIRKGVYVENLTELEVESVRDILRLLKQGAANRKVAATNMNRESSRSHSVFTCVVESRWEKDSTTNLRYARLNLVDLAGSERQKTSGAEGERLKEAANINKSLSTLGHVIMVLVDLAQGKQKHVPYRDSRLTFLLQDSLGGNSKTMIIANVSPSICSAAETLSTLRFAQRAKLIQNNAVINEDASGDVTALQHQICLLKEELSLLKRQNVSRSLSFRSAILEDTENEGSAAVPEEKTFEMDHNLSHGLLGSESSGTIRVSTKQLKSLESILAGALRREQMADTNVNQQQAEIEQLNHLVRQREEDTRCTKMMLKFREDKIRRMESLVDGLLPPDSYLTEQNNALSEEIKLLQSRIEKNPEVTVFALENIRLLEQLRRSQDYYEEGEREILLSELSQLRDQFVALLDGKSVEDKHLVMCMEPQEILNLQPDATNKEKDPLFLELEKTHEELDECQCNLDSSLELNAKLTRELNNLNSQLNNLKSMYAGQDAHDQKESHLALPSRQAQVHLLGAVIHQDEEWKNEVNMKHAEEITNLQLELDILKVILDEERSFRHEVEERSVQLHKDLEVKKNELIDAKCVIEALESQQILSSNELEEVRDTNSQYLELLRRQDAELKSSDSKDSPLQAKLKQMQASLEKARRLNSRYQVDQASHNSQEVEMDEVRCQVEAETAEVIVSLQEELATLQQQVDQSNMKELETKQENKQLRELVEERNVEYKLLTEEWERLACEVSEALGEGHLALEEASDQVAFIVDSFPQRRTWVGEQLGRLVRVISEKELFIEELQSSLEDAYKMRDDLDWKLRSLRGATLAITEGQQQENSEREEQIILLKSEVSEKKSIIIELEKQIKVVEDQTRNAEVRATVAFMIVNRLSELNSTCLEGLKKENVERVEALKQKLGEAEGEAAVLNAKLAEERKYVHAIETKISDDILRTKERVEDFKMSVCMLSSCMTEYMEEVEGPDKQVKPENENLREYVDDGVQGPNGAGITQCLKKEVSPMMLEDASDRDAAIILLRKEIESAIESLRGVQAQMAKLLDEKEEIRKSVKQSCKSLECLPEQVIKLQSDMDVLDKEYQFRALELAQKLQIIEEMATEEKKVLESDLSLAQTAEAKKNAENLTLLAKLELAQAAMEEADTMVNALMTENEATKDKIERLKEKEALLTIERDYLMNEVQNLQSSNNQKIQQYECLEKQFETNLTESEDLVRALEDHLEQMATLFMEESKSVVLEIQGLKSQLMCSINLMRASLEDIWSEIIGKDCAISILHLCHMGVLLETVTGLNVENGLLHHGLAESRFVIADLRQHNCRAKRELEMCSVLKGKLLADIKRNFHRVTKKEEETGKIIAKISLFEKKILDLQRQEESMLGLSNSMGYELAALMKEMDWNNKNVLGARFEQERLMRERENMFKKKIGKELAVLLDVCSVNSYDSKDEFEDFEDLIKRHTELVLIDMAAKDFELLIFESEYRQRLLELRKKTVHLVNLESNHDKLRGIFHNLVRDIVLDKVAEELRIEESIEADHESALLNKEVEKCQARIAKMDEDKRTYELEIHSLKEYVDDLQPYLNSRSSELDRLEHIMETNKRLSIQVEILQNENKKHIDDLQRKESSLESCSSCILKLEAELKIKNEELSDMQSSNSIILTGLETKNQDMAILEEKLSSVEKENDKLKLKVEELKAENSRVINDICGKESEFELSSSHLEKKLGCLEASVVTLRSDLEIKSSRLEQTEHSHAVVSKENEYLLNELQFIQHRNDKLFSTLNDNAKCCSSSFEAVALTQSRILNMVLEDDKSSTLLDKMFEEICEFNKWARRFIVEYECLENSVKELISENLSLQVELERKEDIIKGLSFDMSLLQESASNAKDQKDEFKEMVATLEYIEDELDIKSNELDEALSNGQKLESVLQEKTNAIADLELELVRVQESLQLILLENTETKSQMEDLLVAKSSIEEELEDKNKIAERLEVQILQMAASLGQMSELSEGLKSDLSKVTHERDSLEADVLTLKDQLEIAQSLAEENEAIAAETRQMAEVSKTYAVDKEEEVKLLEKSVEELECTINILENKVEIVKGEAERQRLLREELEIELQAVKHQMLNVDSNDFTRQTDEVIGDFEEAEKKVKCLEKDVMEKDAEIAQCKAHISELNVYAEAQAHEYKQKFKALEAMVQQVKSEPAGSSHVANSTTNKPEKNAAKSKGSGSPFKCIGLGLAHQMNSEKDEDLTAARQRIAELEALVASQQKEIFMLNTRLAAAESMTHDVIRDLLGVRLEMTNCASLLNHQHVEKIEGKVRLQSEESDEVVKLRQQLNEFIEERQRWLEVINCKHAEMVASQVALEKLRQQDQFLTTENETLKVENRSHKKRVKELEDEVKKLSGQQNLQQRIHHHAKIKEQNNLLRTQNDDLSGKLRRSESTLSRVKEELARYRSSSGKDPYIDIDEEQRLRNQLENKEEDRVQLAQKLVGLCTNVLKAAGITRPVSEITPSVAEEALLQLSDRVNSSERELQDLRFKSKISSEKRRLSELRQQSSPSSSTRTNDNCPTPRRLSEAPLSPLSR